MTAEPLNVRVARALNWSDVQSLGPRQYGPRWHIPGQELWVGLPPGAELRPGGALATGYERGYLPIPPFGEETPEGWACTGPLIARFKLDIITWSIGPEEAWRATHGPYREISLSLLDAVCRLVLALSEAGRFVLEDRAEFTPEVIYPEACGPDCPCRHAQAPGVPSWQGPDGLRREVVEIDTPADIRAVVLTRAQLARSRWFQMKTEVA